MSDAVLCMLCWELWYGVIRVCGSLVSFINSSHIKRHGPVNSKKKVSLVSDSLSRPGSLSAAEYPIWIPVVLLFRFGEARCFFMARIVHVIRCNSIKFWLSSKFANIKMGLLFPLGCLLHHSPRNRHAHTCNLILSASTFFGCYDWRGGGERHACDRSTEQNKRQNK